MPAGRTRPSLPSSVCVSALIQKYILYGVAKGLRSGALGAISEDLADPELVSGTLLLILNAAVNARYGPEVMNIGWVRTW